MNCQDITEVLLKLALSTINQPLLSLQDFHVFFPERNLILIHFNFQRNIFKVCKISKNFSCLGTSESSHGSNPPSCSERPRVADRGNPFNAGLLA